MNLDELHPLFVGPYAENADVLEDLMVDFLRDHMYWRRHFHPESVPPIPTSARSREDVQEMLATLRHELLRLSADLKRSVPFFSPRYVGHMASDLLLPGLIAKLVTTLYNPNNVVEEAAPATLSKELEVADQLARMIGYPVEPGAPQRAWGHLTSGGTLANYQGLRNIAALKLYPPALAEAARAFGLAEAIEVGPGQTLATADDWALAHLPLEVVVALRQRALQTARDALPARDARAFAQAVEDARFESLGLVDFFCRGGRQETLRPPRVLVPATAHYSWEKALKVLGWGARQLEVVRVDRNMRMDVGALTEALARCEAERQPVLAIVGVLGNTEFGTVDPLHEIFDARDALAARGMHVAVHVDAAWGGYLETVFRRPDGQAHPREVLRKQFHYFPSRTVYDAFTSLHRADSVTIDPHKLGYIPYAAGAYLARERGMIDFIGQRAAYVFDLEDEANAQTLEARLRHLGQYILEGSKPGASVAAAHVTHRVLPLHSEGFGKVLRHTIASCEYFFDALVELRQRLSDVVRITAPMEPDSNLICLAINPVGNASLARMNRFTRAVFSHLRVDPTQPVQHREFIASSTSLLVDKLPAEHAATILGELGVDPETFQAHPQGEDEADHIFILRHTLMNPWLLFEHEGSNTIDRYLEALEGLIRLELARLR